MGNNEVPWSHVEIRARGDELVVVYEFMGKPRVIGKIPFERIEPVQLEDYDG